MWAMKPIHDLNRDAKYDLLGRPRKESINAALPDHIRVWKEGERVLPVKVPDHLLINVLYLYDFGISIELGSSSVPKGFPPSNYCSPERLHGKEPSTACGMWSYMHLFSRLYIGFAPLDIISQHGQIGSIVRYAGPMPQEWKGLLLGQDTVDFLYDPNTRATESFEDSIRKFRGCVTLIPLEIQQAVSVLTRGFSPDPKKRLTATELLADPSSNAIIDRYCG